MRTETRAASIPAGIVAWIPALFLALGFTMFGGVKLVGQPGMVPEFAQIGFGQWFRFVTGLLEVSGAIGTDAASAVLGRPAACHGNGRCDRRQPRDPSPALHGWPHGPGKSNIILGFGGFSFLLLLLLIKGATIELSALADHAETVAILTAVFAAARWRTSERASTEQPVVQFEEEQKPVLLGLGVFRDGVLPSPAAE